MVFPKTGALPPAVAGPPGGSPDEAGSKNRMCEGKDGARCIFSAKQPLARNRARSGRTTCAWCGDDLANSLGNNQARGGMRHLLANLAGEAKSEAPRRAPWLADKAPAIGADAETSLAPTKKLPARMQCPGTGASSCVFNADDPGRPGRKKKDGSKCNWCSVAEDPAREMGRQEARRLLEAFRKFTGHARARAAAVAPWVATMEGDAQTSEEEAPPPPLGCSGRALAQAAARSS